MEQKEIEKKILEIIQDYVHCVDWERASKRLATFFKQELEQERKRIREEYEKQIEHLENKAGQQQEQLEEAEKYIRNQLG